MKKVLKVIGRIISILSHLVLLAIPVSFITFGLYMAFHNGIDWFWLIFFVILPISAGIAQIEEVIRFYKLHSRWWKKDDEDDNK